VIAAILVPLVALAPSCAAPSHEVRLESENGPPVDFVAESGGTPIAIPEAELWESFRKAARHVAVRADPLAAAEETFALAEGSGTYRYFVRSGLLAPETLHGLEEVDDAAERMTREYQEWCGGTRMGGGDCLHLLAHSPTLTLHGRYVVTVVMALVDSFGPMLDSLEELADPNAVAVMLASAVAMYLLLLLVPEPISKVISLLVTGALIGYLGLTTFWDLVYGARAMSRTVDSATELSQLRAAAREFGKVLGPRMGQLLILLVCHSLGKGIAASGPPRFAQAGAQAQRLLRVRLAAASAARQVTLGAGVITVSLATGAMAIGAPSDPPPSLLAEDERATAELARTLRFTETSAKHMAEAGRQVPRHTLADAIRHGARMADPQGAPGAVKIVQEIVVNGTKRTLEIIYRESDHTVLHFLYR